MPAACPTSKATDKPARKRFKACPIGYVHIDIAEVQAAEGKLYRFGAIDRTPSLCGPAQKAGKMAAAAFLRALIAAVPYKLDIVLTDSGIQFTNHGRHIYAFEHIFDRVCREYEIDHRLTKIKHPRTSGQVERMNARSKAPPSSGSTPTTTGSCASISVTSSAPTTSGRDRRPSRASRPTNTSARSGPQSRIDPSSTQSTRCRD